MTKVLVIEDEKSIADTIMFALKQEGFECEWITLGSKALELQQSTPFDFWILDVGLPDVNGFDVCKSLRKFSEIPVIFLTARDNEIDRIVGLEIGADDYIAKPFSPRELVTRVKVILKRIHNHPNVMDVNTQNSSQFIADEKSYAILFEGDRLPLTRHEYQIFSHLLAHPKHVLSRDQLLNAVGINGDGCYERTIDTHIKSIRAKIREINEDLDVIKTHRGFGYSYEPQD